MSVDSYCTYIGNQVSVGYIFAGLTKLTEEVLVGRTIRLKGTGL